MKKIKLFLILAFIFGFTSFYICQPMAVFAANDENGKEEDSEEMEEDDETQASPAISDTKLTIPVQGAKKKKLSVLNPEDGATYIFKSNHAKIVSVKKKTGVLTAKKAGKVTISLYKKDGKKKQLVGKCNVTAAKAKIKKKNQTVKASINSVVKPVITYPNAKAEYRYKSNKPAVVKVEEIIDEETGATSLVIKALGEGKAVITVKEKYKKKTTKIGTVTVNVKKPSLATETIMMIKGQEASIKSMIKIMNEDKTANAEYEYESSNTEALSLDDDTITANAAATDIIITVYRIVEDEKTLLGTIHVTIEESSENRPTADPGSNYVDLSDYNNDYEEGFDEYDDNDYYAVGDNFIENETGEDEDDTYDDYDKYKDESEHSW